MSKVDGQNLAPDKAHILVVEDDRVLSETLGKVLRREGYGVSLAMHFSEALEVLEADQPVDLMLADIVMPNSINGIALSRMARMRRRDLKIVYMTGYDIPGVEREALGPILQKPIDERLLIEQVERSLAV